MPVPCVALSMISGNAGVILPHCTCFRPALQGGFPKRKPVSAVHVRRPIISQNPFDNWHKGRYNKNTGRCLLVTDIPLLWDLNGCHDTYNYCESNDPMSRLLVADGSLLSVMELVPRLIKHPGNGNDPEHILKCNRNMYNLPEKNFPRGYTHSALAGWQATVFDRLPSIADGRLHRFIISNHCANVNS